MIVPATPPTTAPMIAPLVVDPVWLPITAPTTPPAPAPIIAPSSFLFSDAQADIASPRHRHAIVLRERPTVGRTFRNFITSLMIEDDYRSGPSRLVGDATTGRSRRACSVGDVGHQSSVRHRPQCSSA